ncbi:pyridoxal phosphate-dependent aminotransferase [Streptomyces silaceus]|uniref:pyridoxal phosphate-dependent aminotransferase n=1 Tax=Streptomyces silaceus TaxID=545123 RepID=UPI0006EBAF29|nr:pyridoxal phosphate-dependent aminotransferase [Streptomyces silaceus]
MTTETGLFSGIVTGAPLALPEEAARRASTVPRSAGVLMDPSPDDRLTEIFRRAADPENPMELRDLYLGRMESELGRHSTRHELARGWRESRVRREFDTDGVLTSRATVRFVKEMFNYYFRDDLYGELRPTAEVILSGGAVDEEAWGLPGVLKECVSYALRRDWYGYSDSRGREASREAVAAYESARLGVPAYGAANVALTMGATFAISSLADFLLPRGTTTAPALCALPNYPPLVESVARRTDVRLVPLPARDGTSSLRPLIDQLRPDTPLVLLQTAANPTGALVPEEELEELIKAASPRTVIVLDECHEWLGRANALSALRAAPHVVRVSSLSKNWSAPGIKAGWIIADSAFVDEYYEYASTTFGGPPSFSYTLVEVLARMERWLVTGVEEAGAEHAAEFEPHYGIRPRALAAAFHAYRSDRLARQESLMTLRDAVTGGLDLPGITVMPAENSINLALSFDDYEDSYLCFRDLLRETGVSVFPGLLTFCLSGGSVRITSARRWEELSVALDRLADRQHRIRHTLRTTASQRKKAHR